MVLGLQALEYMRIFTTNPFEEVLMDIPFLAWQFGEVLIYGHHLFLVHGHPDVHCRFAGHL
jgi:hypothetical protein